MSDLPALPEILLVEDNPGDVRLIEELLDEAADRHPGPADDASPGADRLRHAGRLEEGLERLDEGRVDLVLLDLGLPDSTGLATLETVLERARDVPVVVLTGLDDETVGVRAVKQGAQAYLLKDELTPTLLARSIRHAVERKKFERTQAALRRASREFIDADSPGAVSRLAVDTATDVLDLPGIAVYLFDDSSNELRRAAATDAATSVFGEIPSFGPADTSITWRAFIDGETTAVDDLRDAEDAYRRDTPLRSALWIPLGDHGVLIVVSEDVGGFDQQTRQLADHLAATTEATLDRVEREESLRERERELSERNRQLEELDRTNEIIREIDQALVRATTRDSIEQSVCDLLTGDDRYAFAWIGDVADGDSLEPRTWAGAGGGYLDAVSLATDAADGPPSVTAAATGDVSLASNVASDLRGAPWRKAALARDLQSAVAVPLTYADLSYGVLTVFATEPDAFDERSTDVFAELGETIANALNSAETRQALLTDAVVELELVVHDSGDVLARLAAAADCRIEYGGFVPQSDDADRLFVTASGAAPGALAAAAGDVPSVRRLEAIGDADADEGRYELIVSGRTIPATIVECGAAARSIRVTESGTEVVVELPAATDVRTFVDRLEAHYPDTELVARRDRERGDRSEGTVGTTLAAELTERQLETLQTAYHSGYFEWPRDRTGEEVAESLGITQPTFNGHLRAAERKLCAALFDGAASPPD